MCNRSEYVLEEYRIEAVSLKKRLGDLSSTSVHALILLYMSGSAWIEFEINFQFLGCVGEHGERLLLIAMLVSSSTLWARSSVWENLVIALRWTIGKSTETIEEGMVPAWILREIIFVRFMPLCLAIIQ